MSFDFNNHSTTVLPILSNEEAGSTFKKWSFINIYSLTALRDIYILTSKSQKVNLKSITTIVNENEIKKDIEKKFTPFTERNVLEYLNALVKFELMNEDYSVKKQCFLNSTINSKLNEDDNRILKNIFFNYFRFKELSSWFINHTQEFHKEFDLLKERDFIDNSHSLFFYSDECRFYNTFLINIFDPENKFIIENDIVMRFWDVYVKWGTTLGILEKFNVSRILNPIKNKEVSITYFIKEFIPFDFESFISDNFNVKNIWIPELIYKIADKFRYSVCDIKNYILHNIQSNEKITYERTSEIFLIKGKNSKKNIKDATYLYPLIDNYYISNLIVRK